MKNMIKPSSTPVHAEGESLSEWFCHLDDTTSPSECSSISVPFAELAISYMDDTSESSSRCENEEYGGDEQDGLSHVATNRGKKILLSLT